MTQPALDREAILHAIEGWAHDEQLALAREIERRASALSTPKRYASFMGALGLLATPGQPAPTDEEIERWRMEKYGDLS